MQTLPRRPSGRPNRSVAPVAAVVIIGAVLSVGVYQYSRRLQAEHWEAEFSRRAEIRHALTREVINYYISAVQSLRGLFVGSNDVSRGEFRQVANELISANPGITALQWVPIVSSAERARIEAEISRELGRPFEFQQTSSDLTAPMIRAADRAEHYPILYVEPLATNERALGFDIQSAVTLPFLERARRIGQLVATAQFQLVQGRSGVVIVCPVYGYAPVPQSSSRCIGFVQGVFRVEEMLEQSFRRSPPDATDTLYVDDTAASPADRHLYYRPARSKVADTPIPTEADFRRGPHRQLFIEFGDRRWLALYRPNAAWLAERHTLQSEGWLLLGLVITALIAGLVAAMARRTSAIEREVIERTRELEESRRQLDNLLHALPGMAFRARYDDHLSVLFVSEGSFGVTGCRPEEFMSGAVHFRDLIHPEDTERVRTVTRSALAEQRDFEVEYRICPRGGPEKWVLSRGRGVYTDEQQLLFFEGLTIDITARKQAETDKLALERKLLESQKLESLGLLAGGIAHDFNNLLTGIMGNASLARHQEDVQPELSDHLRKIEAAAGRAAELCQQMLAYSGRGRFLVESVNLAQLVTDTLPLLKGSLAPRARLELALASEPTLIMADATQIRQIVMNLILNAGDALGAAGGEIAVTVGRRPFDREFLAAARVGDTLPPAEYVFLEVRDTGSGMSPETLAKIFDPFFTTKFTGRGLGLAAVLGIVRGHSGALHVRSTPGVGSTFTLILPPSSLRAVGLRSTASATPWRQKGRILVIDDEAPVREVAAQLLSTFGFAVVTAADGSEGIAVFGRDPTSFDLVFLDLTMPGLDGEETLAALRAISPDVRVLLVSGYSENDRIADLARRGPLLFLQKPFTRARLEQKLREILA